MTSKKQVVIAVFPNNELVFKHSELSQDLFYPFCHVV
jgi:hypothetical protein